MRKTNFLRCSLRQVDLTGCDLSQAVFDGCDPVVNRVKKARFSLEGVRGLLGKFNILIE